MRAHRLIVAVAVALTVLATPAFAHETGNDTVTHAASNKMQVKMTVKPDAMNGYNVFLETKGFTWAPEHVNGAYEKGEGHAHLYVDDVKITRLYGPAYYLGSLTAPGPHAVRVTLNANDHGEYVRGGKTIEAERTVTVAESTASTTTDMHGG